MFPYFVKGEIVAGFGRGSKELGFPTANFPEDIVNALPEEFNCGIYFGWACVDDGPVYKMVMSVGYNPFYNNTKKTMETHILHSFDAPLHGSALSVCILGYIRPEKNYPSLDALIAAIKEDISYAETQLDLPENRRCSMDSFFSNPLSS